MLETELQRLIVRAVRADGGASHKMSNRHLIGVSDLLVKLPDRPAALFEVKIIKLTPASRVKETKRFTLAVTHLQQEFLKAYDRAGMVTGVISGVHRAPKLYLACFHLDGLAASWYGVALADHVVNGRDPAAICNMIRSYIDGQDKEVTA